MNDTNQIYVTCFLHYCSVSFVPRVYLEGALSHDFFDWHIPTICAQKSILLGYSACSCTAVCMGSCYHDDVIKSKYFPRYWPFVRGLHRSPLNPPHKSQWRGALMFFFICAINGWVINREAGDLRRHCAHYDVIVMPPVVHLAPL